MVAALGSAGFVSGHFLNGAVPREPPAAPGAPAGPLLPPVLHQICPGASDRHGAGAGPDTPAHTQEEGLEVALFHSPAD